LFSGLADVIVGVPGLYHDNRSDGLGCDKGKGWLGPRSGAWPEPTLDIVPGRGGDLRPQRAATPRSSRGTA